MKRLLTRPDLPYCLTCGRGAHRASEAARKPQGVTWRGPVRSTERVAAQLDTAGVGGAHRVRDFLAVQSHQLRGVVRQREEDAWRLALLAQALELVPGHVPRPGLQHLGVCRVRALTEATASHAPPVEVAPQCLHSPLRQHCGKHAKRAALR